MPEASWAGLARPAGRVLSSARGIKLLFMSGLGLSSDDEWLHQANGAEDMCYCLLFPLRLKTSNQP